MVWLHQPQLSESHCCQQQLWYQYHGFWLVLINAGRKLCRVKTGTSGQSNLRVRGNGYLNSLDQWRIDACNVFQQGRQGQYTQMLLKIHLFHHLHNTLCNRHQFLMAQDYSSGSTGTARGKRNFLRMPVSISACNWL